MAERIKDLLVSEENLVEIFNDAVADELDYLTTLPGKTDPAGPSVPLSIDLSDLTAKIEGPAAAQAASFHARHHVSQEDPTRL